MSKIELIKQAIEKAERHESKLSGDVLNVPSFTSVKIRHLVNNLGAISTNFLEIGSHRGGTFCSTIHKNDNLHRAIAVDNFEEFYKDGETKEDFLNNVNKYAPDGLLWELREEQMKNRRTTIYIPYDGVQYTITELAVLLGKSREWVRWHYVRKPSIKQVVK